MIITIYRLRLTDGRLKQSELHVAPAIRRNLALADRHANEAFHRPIRLAVFA